MIDQYTRDSRIYFAYGSDMNTEQLKLRVFRYEVLGVAVLEGFKLDFHGHTFVWDSALETVSGEEGEQVWGVVYKLSSSDGQQLDSYMDVRLDGTGPYFHYPAAVTDTFGNRHYVYLYRKNMLGAVLPPSKEYMNLIVEGAKQHGLPEGYVNKLKTIKTKNAEYAVPMGAIQPRIGCTGCDDLLKK